MNLHARIVFGINNRLQHADLDLRRRVIDKTLQDMDKINVFTPLHLMVEQQDEWDLEEGEQIVGLSSADDDIEDRIRKWQTHYGFEWDSEDEIAAKVLKNERCGKTDLHEAIAARDATSVLRILTQGTADMSIEDNNGYTPAHAAVVEGHETIIEMFKERGLLD